MSENSESVVNLVNPSGQIVGVSKDQLDEALSNGYRKPSSEESTKLKEEKTYGEHPIKAGLLGAAGTATFGAVPKLLAGIPGFIPAAVPSEEQAGLAKYNPAARLTGQAAGVIVPTIAAALTGGTSAGVEGAAETAAATRIGLADLLNPIGAVSKIGAKAGEAAEPVAKAAANIFSNAETSPIVNSILANAGKQAVGSSVESAFYGLGSALDESALGDPEALGEHLLPTLGYSTAIGLTLGAGIGGIAGAFRGVKGKYFSPEIKNASLKDAIKEQAEEAAKPVTPTSMEEVEEALKTAKYKGIEPGELPARGELDAALSSVPDLEYGVTNLQKEALTSQANHDNFRSWLETQDHYAKNMRAYQGLQKYELNGKINSEIKGLAPGMEVTSDASRGGQSLVDAFTKQYEEEKKALAPLFKRFDEVGGTVLKTPDDVMGIANEAIPGSAEFLKLDKETGKLRLDKYEASMPFSKGAHGALKDLVELSNKENPTFGQLRNVRESMRDSVNWLTAPREAQQISALRKSLMDYMERGVQEIDKDIKVRDTFRRYAINEEKRQVIEQIFGGSISNKATFAKEIKAPEDIFNKLFSNSGTVEAARTILNKNDFNKALADYLSHNISKATDNARIGFSSNKFFSFLKSKEPELAAAFGENAKSHARIKAMTQIMRIFPDTAPINPSGTAKTLGILEAIHKLGGVISHPMEAGKGVLEKFSEKLEALRKHEEINLIMSGKSAKDAEEAINKKYSIYNVHKHVEDSVKKNTNRILKGASSVLESPTIPYAAGKAGAKMVDRDKKHKETIHAINDLNENPEKFIDHLEGLTKGAYAAAPNVTGSLHATIVRATSFLASKAPKPIGVTAFSDEYQPSNQELAKFETYHKVVDDPISVLDSLQHVSVTNEHIEALSTVYPKLYEQMKMEVMTNLMENKAKKKQIPYAKKMALSLFLQSDLDNSLTQQAISSNQVALLKNKLDNNEDARMTAPNTTLGGLKELSKSGRTLTAMQDIAGKAQNG